MKNILFCILVFICGCSSQEMVRKKFHDKKVWELKQEILRKELLLDRLAYQIRGLAYRIDFAASDCFNEKLGIEK